MSYKDFKTYWDQLEICNLNPITLSGEDCSEHNAWKVKTVNGKYFPTIDISTFFHLNFIFHDDFTFDLS